MVTDKGAVDTAAGKGYMIDNQWLCQEGALRFNPINCQEHDVTDGAGNTYSVLGSSTKDGSTFQNTVVLAAPQLHFNAGALGGKIVSSANLIAIGQRVYGGFSPALSGEDLSARTEALVSLTTVPYSIDQFTRPTRAQ